MKPADNIKNLFENSKITVGKDVDKKILNKAASALPRRTNADKNIWSIIMHNKLTKPLAAAIIFIVGIMSLTVWDTTVTPAQAMEQMRHAMEDVFWMHSYADTTKIDGKSSEIWLSLPLGIEARRDENGQVSFTDIKKNETRIYDPNSGALTLTVADRNDLYKANSTAELLDLIIETLNDNDHAEMTTKTALFKGEKVTVYKIKIPRGDPPGSIGTEIWQLTASPKSHLLKRMVLEGWDETKTYIKFADFELDYPKTGPLSIYDLDVPQNAAIIDRRPSNDVKTVIDHYKATLENEPTHYTALILYTRYENGNHIADEATIVYTDGDLQRKEQLSIAGNLLDAQHKGDIYLIEEMGNTFDSIFSWWNNPERLRRRYAEMYDGKHLHTAYQHFNDARECNEDTYRKSRRKHFRVQSFYRGRTGEADVFRIDSQSPEVTLIENDFAKDHGLICLQKLDEIDGAKWHTEQTAYGRRYKRLCYLDPQKDYICQRLETYFIQDKYWEKDKFARASENLVTNPNQSLEYTQLKTREITQYAQTASGFWYPSEIQWHTSTQRENGQIKERLSVIKFYLDAERPLPEDIFNPESFMKYLSE